MICTRWLQLAIIIAALYILSQVTSIYLPLILSTIAAFVLNPVVNTLAKPTLGPAKRGIPRSVAILLAFLLSTLFLSFLVTFILFPFVKEFDNLVANLPALLIKIQNVTIAVKERAHSAEVPENIRVLTDQAISRAASYSIELARRILNAILSFASQVIELVVVPVLTYYFLKDWRELKKGVVFLFPVNLRQKASNVIEEMGIVVSNYIRGQLLVSVAVGILVFAGMYILQVEYPLVLGLLAAITETIPIIGPIIGALPAIMLAYVVSPALAIKVVAFYLIVQQLENHIIMPKIMGQTIEIHPVIVIISLLIGGQLYGILGMILAVPLAAIIRVLLRHLWYYGER